MTLFEAICVGYLVIAGAGLTYYGREAFEIGWYSERAWSGLLGSVGLVFGLFCLILGLTS